jgi:acyl carrier protein
LEDNLNITKDLGFSSLDIAQLIASLEIELDADPFSDGVPISSISTIGELCEVYRTYLEQ